MIAQSGTLGQREPHFAQADWLHSTGRPQYRQILMRLR